MFHTVSVDATYYAFPRPQFLESLAAAAPKGFRFGFKVTDAITVRRFPKVAPFGNQAGKPNEGFLDAGPFTEAFLRPCLASDRKNKDPFRVVGQAARGESEVCSGAWWGGCAGPQGGA